MKVDPRHHQQLHRSIRVVLIALILAAVGWAIMPERDETVGFDLDGHTQPHPINITSQLRPDAFDPGVFDVTLWYEPPTPDPQAPSRPALPPRLTLELMAISVEAGPDVQPVRVAVVYDTQDDTVHTLHVGDRCGGAVIESISEDGVDIRVGTQSVRLALELAG